MAAIELAVVRIPAKEVFLVKCAAAHYFRRSSEHVFEAAPLVQGAWNPSEQHIAPSLGLLTHVIERDLERRRGGDLSLARISFEILGAIPIGVVSSDVTVLRAGRTIELVEARLLYEKRPVVLARAWYLHDFGTSNLSGSSFPPMPPVETVPPWDMGSFWPGACIESIEVRRESLEVGRARAWLRTDVELVAGEPIAAMARTMTMVDIANGITLRISPDEAIFPNVDLTAHLFRSPSAGWLGLDTTVAVGRRGVGLTHSVLHDCDGAVGVVSQSLTVRPQ